VIDPYIRRYLKNIQKNVRKAYYKKDAELTLAVLYNIANTIESYIRELEITSDGQYHFNKEGNVICDICENICPFHNKLKTFMAFHSPRVKGTYCSEECAVIGITLDIGDR
jgi:hypothetical protein